MDELEKYINNNELSKSNILKYVDDYSIYSFYIGTELELRTKYSSPLRPTDQDPSFSLYYSKTQSDVIMFKDNATGKTGDVFIFMQWLLGGGVERVPLTQVLLQIDRNFGLGLKCQNSDSEFKPQLIKQKPLRKSPSKIEVTIRKEESQEYIDFWSSLDISLDTRQKFYTNDVEIIHYIGDFHRSVVPKTVAVSYEILGTYKIYQPFEDRKFKFRNNFKENYVEGGLQLEFQKDFCIITKSTKECLFFWEHFKWDAVAGKSENTPIPPHFMEVLRTRYKRVYIWLDSDEAGISAQLRYTTQYPWLIPIVMHPSVEEKDPTDLYTRCKQEGTEFKALKYFKSLIN